MLNIPARAVPGARFVATAALLVASALSASPASASAGGHAVWNAPNGGGSTCTQTTTTTVTCRHTYSSITIMPNGFPVETCVTGGVYVAFPQSQTYLDSCHAELDVTTSGPGRLVTANGAVCDTVAIERLGFTISTPYGIYDLAVTVENNEVVSTVNGREVLVDGTLWENVNATFTGGCGVATRGAFQGNFTLTVV